MIIPKKKLLKLSHKKSKDMKIKKKSQKGGSIFNKPSGHTTVFNLPFQQDKDYNNKLQKYTCHDYGPLCANKESDIYLRINGKYYEIVNSNCLGYIHIPTETENKPYNIRYNPNQRIIGNFLGSNYKCDYSYNPMSFNNFPDNEFNYFTQTDTNWNPIKYSLNIETDITFTPSSKSEEFFVLKARNKNIHSLVNLVNAEENVIDNINIPMNDKNTRWLTNRIYKWIILIKNQNLFKAGAAAVAAGAVAEVEKEVNNQPMIDIEIPEQFKPFFQAQETERLNRYNYIKFIRDRYDITDTDLGLSRNYLTKIQPLGDRKLISLKIGDNIEDQNMLIFEYFFKYLNENFSQIISDFETHLLSQIENNKKYLCRKYCVPEDNLSQNIDKNLLVLYLSQEKITNILVNFISDIQTNQESYKIKGAYITFDNLDKATYQKYLRLSLDPFRKIHHGGFFDPFSEIQSYYIESDYPSNLKILNDNLKLVNIILKNETDLHQISDLKWIQFKEEKLNGSQSKKIEKFITELTEFLNNYKQFSSDTYISTDILNNLTDDTLFKNIFTPVVDDIPEDNYQDTEKLHFYNFNLYLKPRISMIYSQYLSYYATYIKTTIFPILRKKISIITEINQHVGSYCQFQNIEFKDFIRDHLDSNIDNKSNNFIDFLKIIFNLESNYDLSNTNINLVVGQEYKINLEKSLSNIKQLFVKQVKEEFNLSSEKHEERIQSILKEKIDTLRVKSKIDESKRIQLTNKINALYAPYQDLLTKITEINNIYQFIIEYLNNGKKETALPGITIPPELHTIIKNFILIQTKLVNKEYQLCVQKKEQLRVKIFNLNLVKNSKLRPWKMPRKPYEDPEYMKKIKEFIEANIGTFQEYQNPETNEKVLNEVLHSDSVYTQLRELYIQLKENSNIITEKETEKAENDEKFKIEQYKKSILESNLRIDSDGDEVIIGKLNSLLTEVLNSGQNPGTTFYLKYIIIIILDYKLKDLFKLINVNNNNDLVHIKLKIKYNKEYFSKYIYINKNLSKNNLYTLIEDDLKVDQGKNLVKEIVDKNKTVLIRNDDIINLDIDDVIEVNINDDDDLNINLNEICQVISFSELKELENILENKFNSSIEYLENSNPLSFHNDKNASILEKITKKNLFFLQTRQKEKEGLFINILRTLNQQNFSSEQLNEVWAAFVNSQLTILKEQSESDDPNIILQQALNALYLERIKNIDAKLLLKINKTIGIEIIDPKYLVVDNFITDADLTQQQKILTILSLFFQLQINTKLDDNAISNPYEILGVNSSEDPKTIAETIKTKHRSLSHIYHPDIIVNKSLIEQEFAQELSKRINSANDCLGSIEERNKFNTQQRHYTDNYSKLFFYNNLENISRNAVLINFIKTHIFSSPKIFLKKFEEELVQVIIDIDSTNNLKHLHTYKYKPDPKLYLKTQFQQLSENGNIRILICIFVLLAYLNLQWKNIYQSKDEITQINGSLEWNINFDEFILLSIESLVPVVRELINSINNFFRINKLYSLSMARCLSFYDYLFSFQRDDYCLDKEYLFKLIENYRVFKTVKISFDKYYQHFDLNGQESKQEVLLNNKLDLIHQAVKDIQFLKEKIPKIQQSKRDYDRVDSEFKDYYKTQLQRIKSRLRSTTTEFNATISIIEQDQSKETIKTTQLISNNERLVRELTTQTEQQSSELQQLQQNISRESEDVETIKRELEKKKKDLDYNKQELRQNREYLDRIPEIQKQKIDHQQSSYDSYKNEQEQLITNYSDDRFIDQRIGEKKDSIISSSKLLIEEINEKLTTISQNSQNFDGNSFATCSISFENLDTSNSIQGNLSTFLSKINENSEYYQNLVTGYKKCKKFRLLSQTYEKAISDCFEDFTSIIQNITLIQNNFFNFVVHLINKNPTTDLKSSTQQDIDLELLSSNFNMVFIERDSSNGGNKIKSCISKKSLLFKAKKKSKSKTGAIINKPSKKFQLRLSKKLNNRNQFPHKGQLSHQNLSQKNNNPSSKILSRKMSLRKR